MTIHNWYRSLAVFLLLVCFSACQDDEPDIDWTQQEYYSPATDAVGGDELVLSLAGNEFRRRDESIEQLADRLGLTPLDTTDFSFRVYSGEINDNGDIIDYLPSLISDSLSGSTTNKWVYQSGRYVFRFQESDVHRFVSIVEKLSTRALTDGAGQPFIVAGQSTARLYVNNEDIIDRTVGIKRERLTFAEELGDLAEEYPGLSLPPETIALTNYQYDTVLADSLDDNVVNEKRVRVLMAVYENE